MGIRKYNCNQIIMKLKHLLIFFTILTTGAVGAKEPEWQDPLINAVNRAPMHAVYFAYASESEAAAGVRESSSNYMSINGRDRKSVV